MFKRTAVLLLAALMLCTSGTAPVFAAKGESTEYEDWAEPVKLVALTFDDGPGAYTEYLLDELAERDVHATFFMVGRNTTGKFKPLVERAISEGHQVASHSYKHAYLTKYSASGMKSDLEKTAAALNDAAGGSFSYMLRPPYGAKNSTLLKTAGVPLIIWSVDPYDWKYRDADYVSQNVIGSVKDGDIILLHDIHQTSVEAALIIIDTLSQMNYEFVTVTELARRKGYEPEAGSAYYSFRGETAAERVSEPSVSVFPHLGGYCVVVTVEDGAPVYLSFDGSDPSQGEPLSRTGHNRYRALVPRDSVVRVIAAWDVNGDRSREIDIDLHGEEWID
jgi:peptidoglycan/xylan/chitin deacetylase (PgdA/CDA1 family)